MGGRGRPEEIGAGADASATGLANAENLLHGQAMKKFTGRLLAAVGGFALWATVAVADDAPRSVTLISATKLEIMRAGKVSGSVALKAGEVLEVVTLEGDFVNVRYKGLAGRVAVGKTDLSQKIEAAAEAAARKKIEDEAAALAAEAAAIAAEAKDVVPPAKKTPAPAPSAVAVPARSGVTRPVAGTKENPSAVAPGETPPAPGSAARPETRPPVAVGAKTPSADAPRAAAGEPLPAVNIAEVLAGHLVQWQGSNLVPVPPERLAQAKIFAVYFAAGSDVACREFTQNLSDAYGKMRPFYPEFEVVLVSRDKSAADMLAYLRDDRTPWPALAWEAIGGLTDITRYAGRAIPCLVVVDAQGKVLSDSYRGGAYVGTDAVLDDAWRIMKEFRRKNPRAKS